MNIGRHGEVYETAQPRADSDDYRAWKEAIAAAINETCTEVERELGIRLSELPPGANVLPLSYLLVARQDLFAWRFADGSNFLSTAKNKRRRKFFRSIRMAYQIATGTAGRVTKTGNVYSGEFLCFARICSMRMLPAHMQPESDGALAKIIEHIIDRNPITGKQLGNHAKKCAGRPKATKK